MYDPRTDQIWGTTTLEDELGASDIGGTALKARDKGWAAQEGVDEAGGQDWRLAAGGLVGDKRRWPTGGLAGHQQVQPTAQEQVVE